MGDTVGGYELTIEARLVRSQVFAGVILLTTARDGTPLLPPVIIIVPGQWPSQTAAREAATEYAILMANNGTLEQAIAMRMAA